MEQTNLTRLKPKTSSVSMLSSKTFLSILLSMLLLWLLMGKDPFAVLRIVCNRNPPPHCCLFSLPFLLAMNNYKRRPYSSNFFFLPMSFHPKNQFYRILKFVEQIKPFRVYFQEMISCTDLDRLMCNSHHVTQCGSSEFT